MLISSATNRVFYQTKYYGIGICCFSFQDLELRSMIKDSVAPNQDNVSKWSEISIRGLFPQCANTIQFQLSMLVLYKEHIISLKCSQRHLYIYWISWPACDFHVLKADRYVLYVTIKTLPSLTLFVSQHFMMGDMHEKKKSTFSKHTFLLPLFGDRSVNNFYICDYMNN